MKISFRPVYFFVLLFVMFIPSACFIFIDQSYFWDLGLNGGRLMSYAALKYMVWTGAALFAVCVFDKFLIQVLISIFALENAIFVAILGTGFFGNHGVDLMFCLLCVPIILEIFPWYILAPIAWATLATRTSTAVAILFFQLSAFLFYRVRMDLKKILLYSAVMIFAAGFVISKDGAGLLESGGRVEIWRVLIAAWKNQPWIGYGAGTWEILGPHFQIMNNMKDGGIYRFFIFAHNDWAQLLFEFGILGAVGFMTIYVAAIARSFKKNFNYFVGLLCFGMFAVLWFPLHMFSTLFVFVFMVKNALCEEAKCQ